MKTTRFRRPRSGFKGHTPRGLEHTAESPTKTQIPETGGAESGALDGEIGPETAPADADLQAVIRAWPALSGSIRAAILTLAQTATPAGAGESQSRSGLKAEAEAFAALASANISPEPRTASRQRRGEHRPAGHEVKP